jgi:hypothetical protein
MPRKPIGSSAAWPNCWAGPRRDLDDDLISGWRWNEGVSKAPRQKHGGEPRSEKVGAGDTANDLPGDDGYKSLHC